MRVLVVCAGNTCRSPAGEAAIRRAAEVGGMAMHVSSCGVRAEVGRPPTPAMVRAGRRRGLEISGTATQATVDAVRSADRVLAMDEHTRSLLSVIAPGTRVELLGGFDPVTDGDEIPDPWGRPDSDYRKTLDRIIAASEAFVASLSD